MKRLKLILILLLIFLNMKGQKEYYILKSIATDSYSIELQNNKFQIYYFKKKDFPGAIGIRVQVMEGNIKKKGKVYELSDTLSAKKYHIQYINNEKFFNVNLPFFLKDTLYSSTIRDKDYLIIGNWKNRKKDGLWNYIPNRSGERRKQETYKDGKLIKVIYADK